MNGAAGLIQRVYERRSCTATAGEVSLSTAKGTGRFGLDSVRRAGVEAEDNEQAKTKYKVSYSHVAKDTTTVSGPVTLPVRGSQD